MIAIALCAMLSGANDLMAIFRWGRRLSPKALVALLRHVKMLVRAAPFYLS
jgi:hypothetical protein